MYNFSKLADKLMAHRAPHWSPWWWGWCVIEILITPLPLKRRSHKLFRNVKLQTGEFYHKANRPLFLIQWLHICCWIASRFLPRAQLSSPIYISVIFFRICKYMYFLLLVCYWAVCIVCCLYFLVSVSMLPVCIQRARDHFHPELCDQHHTISKTANGL